jgi:dolichyl-phosphate-mannose-protein mannosyltransferase
MKKLHRLIATPAWPLAALTGLVLGAAVLLRTIWLDAHPPLGKYLIALGIAVFGDVPLGWRIVPLIAGLALVGVGLLTARAMVRSSKREAEDTAHGVPTAMMAGILMALFIAIDGHFIVYSRLGLMDGILVLSMLLTVFAAYKAKSPLQVVGVGMLLGLAVAIKWPAAAMVIPAGYILIRRGKIVDFLLSLPVAFLIYLAVIMSAGWILQKDGFQYAIEWHWQVWNYQMNLTATHPWGSAWWTWPLLQSPVLFFREYLESGDRRAISALPNPVLWLGSGVAVLGTFFWYGVLIGKRKFAEVLAHPTMPMFLAWAASWLPWSPVHRVLFMYHYLPSYVFALLITAYWGAQAWRKSPWLVLAGIVIVFGVTLYFSPLLIGLPRPDAWFTQAIWIPSWVF